jgi:hypothetical protein
MTEILLLFSVPRSHGDTHKPILLLIYKSQIHKNVSTFVIPPEMRLRIGIKVSNHTPSSFPVRRACLLMKQLKAILLVFSKFLLT